MNTPDSFSGSGLRLPTMVGCALFTLFATVAATSPAVAQDVQSRSLTLRLQDVTSTTASSTEFAEQIPHSDLRVLAVEKSSSPKRPQRHIEYSTDQIVVVALAAGGLEKSRVVMTDPRLIRGEIFTEGAGWETVITYRRSVDFTVSMPDDPAISRVDVLKPRWTGSDWQFDVLAEVAIK